MKKLPSGEETEKLQVWVKKSILEKFFIAAKENHLDRNPGTFLGVVIEEWFALRHQDQQSEGKRYVRAGTVLSSQDPPEGHQHQRKKAG